MTIEQEAHARMEAPYHPILRIVLDALDKERMYGRGAEYDPRTLSDEILADCREHAIDLVSADIHRLLDHIDALLGELKVERKKVEALSRTLNMVHWVSPQWNNAEKVLADLEGGSK